MTFQDLKSFVVALIFACLAVWAFGAGHLFASVVFGLASVAMFILTMIIIVLDFKIKWEELKNRSEN